MHDNCDNMVAYLIHGVDEINVYVANNDPADKSQYGHDENTGYEISSDSICQLLTGRLDEQRSNWNIIDKQQHVMWQNSTVTSELIQREFYFHQTEGQPWCTLKYQRVTQVS